MKYLDEFRAPEKVQACLAEIARLLEGRQARIMEVCGTHTVALFRSGLKKLLPRGLELLSGPGCPVCVTPNSYLDRAIALGRLPGVTVTTFGDMFRVPGSSSSLEKEKASGADIRMVYSPADAVELARRDPSRRFVFLGVGFETTIPGVAASILHARATGLANFFVLCGHKLVPPALRALAQDEETAVQGLLLPGHVSTVIGSEPYRFLAEEFHIPSVVAGFEPLDLAKGIAMLARRWKQAAQDPVQRRGLLAVTTTLRWRVEPMFTDALAALREPQTWPECRSGLGAYFLELDAAGDPVAAEILVKAFPKSWEMYPTFARHLKPEALLAWIEGSVLAEGVSAKDACQAWKSIGPAAKPSMQKILATWDEQLKKLEAEGKKNPGLQGNRDTLAKAMEETIAIIKEK